MEPLTAKSYLSINLSSFSPPPLPKTTTTPAHCSMLISHEHSLGARAEGSTLAKHVVVTEGVAGAERGVLAEHCSSATVH
jgi:hypothetical protein